MKKHCCKVEPVQKIREYMLTDLNDLIYKNCSSITDEFLKTYLSSVNGNLVNYEGSYIKYDEATNSFVLVYYLNKKFYKEELYEYSIENGSILYNCMDYSFREGQLH